MTTMQFAFRTDASLQIGTGHVMRCLTLADALTERGAYCHFICREHPGNLIELIRSKGHIVHTLPPPAARTGSLATEQTATHPNLAHGHWLGAPQAQDAEACAPILAAQRPNWLIVDHYALEIHWEQALRNCCPHLMVIDDLADRHHQCDLLLDQNLGRQAVDYESLVPEHCTVLTGPRYALLRPEFAALREASLSRRAAPRLRRLLISMGGVDGPNATSMVLQALQVCSLPSDCEITVVMGSKALWLEQVQEIAKGMPWPTQVLVNVADMGLLMTNSDLSIGAAGSTSWERCCLGLPSIVLVLAENQRFISSELNRTGAAKTIILEAGTLASQLKLVIDSYRTPARLRESAQIAASICDGSGTERVGRILLGK
ncbi:UDP-2,4-diacetamido-2,4,6-trideoxy-beta-L-altropyranose hydrolase [Pseudothauera nasutitermitis]|uniref:UDP-2,4-diacetamido-2,4, 6-trideoxy-beta-L-altropyranose hydrolase n=1 Tax=Pseudothauera nasutitermitis TaxID=2565930 RepID=A0A4S4ATD4_9RHOO|nr:UDP-2,4-diacetamido-2,4,6-trideoxy-beta-L-altropyranose hydrolase [Pseudothauera nasutitermitis]THF63122.1 UDP-2,4-diacetamido-2,4,6-trideoxy-beta-L-altropyranose hydrolase [Pseudothauera nasutitermitis]